MIINGVDLEELEPQSMEAPYPEPVSGRVCHIDGDFLAYNVSAAKDTSLDDMKHNCEVIADKLMRRGAATRRIIYLTPKESDKGNRYNIALLKEYQANRKEKPKPEFLHVIRQWMHQEMGADLCMTHEADDGMAMAQYEAIRAGEQNLSIIASRDKDLAMVPGLALNWVTYEITDTKDQPFGWIDLKTMDNKQKTKKLVGRGSKFFWAQLLMGDAADNISGLPKIYDPKYLKGKPVPCGPVAAYNILQQYNTDKECFDAVLGLYKLAHEHEPFKNWRNSAPITPEQAFSSEASLIWMRRENNPNDFLNWMRENCK